MSKNKRKFRHEIKYLINECDREVISQRIKSVLKLDEHAQGNEYHVRSLYFDDYWDSSYLDKVGGFPGRKKYRIRTYNINSDIINLECKVKVDSYINKVSVPFVREEYNKIMNNDFSFLLKRDEPLCKQFYYECTSRFMRPKVIVDYEREPYIFEAGDVRVTFDKNVRGISPWFDIFDEDIPAYYVLEPGKLVMEVKYTEFLPRVVKDSLADIRAEMSSFSKYVLCSEKVNFLTAKKY